MRNRQNIVDLLKLKPDFIGFIFYPESKRFVDVFPQVDFPETTKKVGVFVNEKLEVIIEKVQQHQLDLVQLHGDESPEYCLELKRNLIGSIACPVKIMKAFSVDGSFDFKKTKTYDTTCAYFLFDTKGRGYGGTGLKFDWNMLVNYKGDTPFLLSGGISKLDAGALKKMKHEALIGVDINSGFELEPAWKNIDDIKEFKDNLL